MPIDFTDFYVAPKGSMFFVPYCDGDICGECKNCTKGVCRGFWGGGNEPENDNEWKHSSKNKEIFDSREARITQLEAAYQDILSSGMPENDMPSPFDTLQPARLEGVSRNTLYNLLHQDYYDKGFFASLGHLLGNSTARPPKIMEPPKGCTPKQANDWRGGYCEGLRLKSKIK